MHSGNFISPRHPAVPVSIGIASIVLEGRPAILDDDAPPLSGDNAAADGSPSGGSGGVPDKDRGFFTPTDCGRRYKAAGGTANQDNQHHLVAECQKSFITNAAKRINLKLQQIRSCPGSSKDVVVENVVTVEAGSSGSGHGGRFRGGEYDGYGVETFVSEARSESSSLMFSAKAWSRNHIYSGFEKMKLLGAVSPMKIQPPTPFLNFSATVNSKKKSSDSGNTSPTATKQRPREGPHCEQFLKKIGVVKLDPHDEVEHSCSYRNEFCLRWQAYFKQLSSLLTRGEAICIEIYLGPENHAILLEQWILKLKIKNSESTMTLQSLCAAIRSQLHFSQISAWTDLIKNSLEPEIFNNPRIRKVPTGCSSACSKPPDSIENDTNGSTSPSVLPKAKLDILFRIRGYDNTACFKENPHVHNFPATIIAENYAIEVCLKSLPRMERIPGVQAELSSKIDTNLINDQMDLPCHEKGKHRCSFQEEEDDPQMGDDDLSSAAISHREKQLMKYKKRMMKREKKKKAVAQEITSTGIITGSDEIVENPPMCKSPALNIPTVNNLSGSCNVTPYTSSINLIQPPLYSNCDDLYQPVSCANNTKATQTAIFHSMSNSGNVASVGTQTEASGCCCLYAKQQHESSEPGRKTTSTISDSKMQYNHNSYNRRDYTNENCDTSHPAEGGDAVVRDKQLVHLQREESKGLRKGEILLQAIQRTAIINDHHQSEVAHFKNNNFYSSYIDNNNIGSSDTSRCERSECDTFAFDEEALDLGDCRLCKRQKTKHNFRLALNKSDSISSNSSNNNSPPGCRRTLSESLVGHFTIPSSPGDGDLSGSNADHIHRSNGHDSCDLSVALSSSTGAVGSGTLSFEQLKSYRRAFSEDVIDTINLNHEFDSKPIGTLHGNDSFQKCDCPALYVQKTSVDYYTGSSSPFVSPNVCRLQTSTPATGNTPIYVSCTESDCSISTASSVSPHKKQILSCTTTSGNMPSKRSTSPSYFTIPKINLSNVFNISPLAREDSGFISSSSPIPIDGSIFNFTEGTEHSVIKKSSSAPTCHLSPGSLSPRFLKHVYKHQRSRHLSERSTVSERSSIGSDEQLSEDEHPCLLDFPTVSCGSYFQLGSTTVPRSPPRINPAQRPFNKSFSKNLFRFGRLPLMGTLEESLLQRRITPKFQVADFKVLLGASGSFCPTQLTIPVASYFYELPGQHLTTPYVSELRLPRKGYSIPRQGTVQVTLLNPLGTVVRMFVVPYDFRDMPAMSMTFIRQRILACDDSNKDALASGRPVEQLSNAEQMRLLRYAIHLRFQTSRSGKLSLHTDIRLLISRRTDCDTAAAHAKNLLEAPNELKVVTIVPENPKYSLRIDKQ
ncbi:protein Atossa isoform X2 [Toxorhynchites rutilus septentrionalis]|nr:protein Atossa isoform X2 [Toxorhynchites rutilus septentrionalis]XP_055636188.1 protein Atossa isoform X2 [Toxorhynchites rutilus septentrionalis]